MSSDTKVHDAISAAKEAEDRAIKRGAMLLILLAAGLGDLPARAAARGAP